MQALCMMFCFIIKLFFFLSFLFILLLGMALVIKVGYERAGNFSLTSFKR